MQKLFKGILALGAAASIAGCSMIQFSRSSNDRFEAAKLSTYQVVQNWNGESTVPLHSSVRLQLTNALSRKLDALGYVKAFPAEPSFVLSFRLEGKGGAEVEGEGAPDGGAPDAAPRAKSYQTLTLVLEAGLPSDKEVLWSGSAEGVRYADDANGTSLVTAANDILATFPMAKK